MKRILVTGGAGFLGSNLCERLVKDPNNYVIAVDNLITGNIKNIEDLLPLHNFEFLRHDICTPLDINVEQIYNAACPASPVSYQKTPTSTVRTCVVGTTNMLDLATRYGATMLQFSTSEVYGDPKVHPQTEDYRGDVNPIGIRACYDEGKRCAETLCFDFHREFGTRIKVVRIFNTYGPNMDMNDGRVVSNFIIQALRNEPITMFGTGLQTRSFCYVDDLIEGIMRMMNETEPDFFGPVNLGNPGEFTMMELAEKVIAMTGSHSQISYLPLPSDDPSKRRPDITLAGEMLGGWKPEIALEQGLEKTIAYFKNEF